MKILVLTKRFGSGKDHILDNFGRQVRIAENLQKIGNDVHILAADYTKKENFNDTNGKVKIFVWPLSIITLPLFIHKLKKLIKKEKYDAIFASSDPIFGVIAYFARKRIKLIYDIQDNYEEYKSYKIPLLKKYEQRAIKSAHLITTASPGLKNSVKHLNKNCIVIENGIDKKRIKIISKEKARKKYKLPTGKIIAYSGRYNGTAQKEGIDSLIKAMQIIKKSHKNYHLILIGDGNKQRIEKESDKTHIHTFDSVDYQTLMEMLSVADVFVIPYTKTPFTDIMYTPYKMAEYMLFSKPIICSDVGEMKKLLKPKYIFQPGNEYDISNKIEIAVKVKKEDYSDQLKKLEWKTLAEKLVKAI